MAPPGGDVNRFPGRRIIIWKSPAECVSIFPKDASMHPSRPIRSLLPALEIQAVSCYVWLSLPGTRTWPMLAAAIVGAATILLGFTGPSSRALSRRTGRTPAEEANGLFIALSPLLLLDLVFLQFLVFLRDIRPVLGPVAFAASAFLIADHLLRRRASHPDLFNTRLDLWLADLVAKPRKTFKLLVGVSFAVYVLLASGAAFPPSRSPETNLTIS